MSEPLARRAQRLTVMLGTQDHAHHQSLAVELLARAKTAHLAGATLLRGVEGQGRSGVVHRHHLVGEDTPLALVLVDDEEKVSAFLEHNQHLLADTVVVVDDVTVLRA